MINSTSGILLRVKVIFQQSHATACSAYMDVTGVDIYDSMAKWVSWFSCVTQLPEGMLSAELSYAPFIAKHIQKFHHHVSLKSFEWSSFAILAPWTRLE